MFRQFYLLVVTYIYFTRIIVYLMDATLPFKYVWLGEFFTELATLLFWCLTGYKFRPVADNPYFDVSDDEGQDDEQPEPVEDEKPPTFTPQDTNPLPSSSDPTIN